MRCPAAGSRGRCGCVSVVSLRRLLSRGRGLSRGERVQHVRHHQLLYARVDGGEVAGLVHSLAHAAVITAAQLRVEDLLEQGGLAVHGCHDAAEVAGLNRVLRHLQGHARDLCVALRELAAASDHPYADQLFDEAHLRFEGVRQLLTRIRPLFEDPREVARRVARCERAAAFNALLYHLEREILLVLQGKDVPEELDVLGREKPVPTARAAEVDQTPSFQVPDLADRECRELGSQTLDDLADSEPVFGSAVPLRRWRITFGAVAFVCLSMYTVVLHPVYSHPLDYS